LSLTDFKGTIWVGVEPKPNDGGSVNFKNIQDFFIDFLLSIKGQQLLRSLHYIPNHVDVEPDPPRMLLKGEKRYFEDFAVYKKIDYYTQLYKTIFPQ